jgi:hypothetical protein
MGGPGHIVTDCDVLPHSVLRGLDLNRRDGHGVPASRNGIEGRLALRQELNVENFTKICHAYFSFAFVIVKEGRPGVAVMAREKTCFTLSPTPSHAAMLSSGFQRNNTLKCYEFGITKATNAPTGVIRAHLLIEVFNYPFALDTISTLARSAGTAALTVAE